MKRPLFQTAVVAPQATFMSVAPSVLAPAGAADPAMKVRVALPPAHVPFSVALLQPLKSWTHWVVVGVAVGTGVPHPLLTVTEKPLLVKGAPGLVISMPASIA